MDKFIVIEKTGKDKDGFPVEATKTYPAYLEEKSVTRMEFYEAFRSGVDVRTILTTRREDYERTRHLVNGKKVYAEKVFYEGEEYEIVRAYMNGKGEVELTCR